MWVKETLRALDGRPTRLAGGALRGMDYRVRAAHRCLYALSGEQVSFDGAGPLRLIIRGSRPSARSRSTTRLPSLPVPPVTSTSRTSTTKTSYYITFSGLTAARTVS
jgi:hypothetical protein